MTEQQSFQKKTSGVDLDVCNLSKLGLKRLAQSLKEKEFKCKTFYHL